MTEPLQETCFVNSNCSTIDGMMRFSHEAMATTFEVIIVHEDERYASQAAVAAFDEVDRLERELSRFIENSDVARINSAGVNQPLQLGLDTFECLKIAGRIYAETNGAFDITIGSMLKCWRNDDGTPRNPSPKEIDLARLHTGMNLLQLDEAEHTVRLSASPVQIDLGGIGKGYAVDRVAELLREWSIDVALISGGYSSVLALDAPVARASRRGEGVPPSNRKQGQDGLATENKARMASPQKGWPLTLTNPAGSREILARPFLQKGALSGSGVQKGGHIIDPRTVQPVVGKRAAWSSAPDAATADALSTAFMIMGLDEIKRYCSMHPETLAMVIVSRASSPRFEGGMPSTPLGDGSLDAPQSSAGRFVPGEVIVKLKEGPIGGIAALSQEAIDARNEAVLLRLQAKYGVEGGRPVFSHAGRQFYVLGTGRDVLAACVELSKDPEVQYAQPNYIYHICRTPNDPDFPDQYAHQLIQMEDAWEISTGSHDIAVAVMDTGVDVNHPDLKDNIWTNKGEVAGNKIDDDGNGYVDDIHGWNFGDNDNKVLPGGTSSSISSHGTQVAGVIAAVGDNGKGVSGVNWQCSIMVLRLSLDFTSEEVAKALDYAAANGARVVNMSFGGDDFGPEGDLIVKTAIDNAFSTGVLLVASAGNSDSSRPHYPAAWYNVMAVASTDGEDAKTGHSTFGPWVDIAAPGTDIVTTNLGNEYVATAGTSFSSPYVAAVAALLFAHRPNLTNIEARAILENTADPVYYGDVDPNQGYIGTGRVNAHRTLLAADRPYPLGEIVGPGPRQTCATDVNAVELCIFVHGDTWTLEYRRCGDTDWMAIAAGASPADPDGFAYASLPNPGVGTYELCLRVATGESIHVDRKVFGIDMAASQAHWPKPDETEDIPDVYFIGYPLCLDVNGDGRNEIVQPAVDFADYWGSGIVNIWDQDGNSLPNWPVEMEYVWPTSTAVGDIDGDGDYEVVVGFEMDGEVSAYHVESGRIVDGNWPVFLGGWYGYIASGPVLADLDGDGDSEILIALDAESRDTDGLYAIQGDGTYLWQRRYTSEGPISVADFDRDGDVEIGISGYGPGLSRVYTFILDHQGQQVARWRGGSKKGTAIADLNADGKPELIFCTDEDVEAVRADGGTLWKTKVSEPLDGPGGLSVGDIDNDGYSEVYISDYVEADGFIFTRVYGFDYKGRQLTAAGFPRIAMGDPTRCVPLIADIDGDGEKELIVGAAGEPMMAWEADGSVTPGFPMLSLSVDIETTPMLEDLDQDGDLEIMLIADDYRFHVLDLPGAYARDKIDWGMVRHDPQNSGWTLAAPRLDPVSAPAEIKPGQRLQVQTTATNPANLPLQWTVGNLPEGAYYDAQSHTVFWKPTADQVFGTYTFSFLVTDGIRQNSRSASVTVVPDAIYYASMDTDPNWTLDEGWAWGDPNEKGSWNGDPNVGHTGANVIGYALDGDYANNLTQTRYATTGPIDCRGYQNIHLSFWRWLGVESPYDYACVQVSQDGVNWTNLWATGVSHVSDSAWQLVEYAVPAAIADGQSTVYFRWGLGPTDDSVTYPGWNLDDVQVTGDPT